MTSPKPRSAGEQIAAATDRELIDGMRRGEWHAFAEFQLRFAPLLHVEARRARIAADERDEWVTDLLDDTIMRLLVPEARAPRAMAAYLVTAFRRRVINAKRGDSRRARVVREAAPQSEAGPSSSDVAALTSEASRRASRGPDGESPAASPIVARFADTIGNALTAEERRLLDWAASHVPQREIAAWLGIGYEAAGKRVRRLRSRLVATSRARLAELDAHDRTVIERLIARGAPLSPIANGLTQESSR